MSDFELKMVFIPAVIAYILLSLPIKKNGKWWACGTDWKHSLLVSCIPGVNILIVLMLIRDRIVGDYEK